MQAGLPFRLDGFPLGGKRFGDERADEFFDGAGVGVMRAEQVARVVEMALRAGAFGERVVV